MLGQWQWLWWGGVGVWMDLELKHRFSLKTNTPQDDLWSWGYVLRQNCVAFLTWLLTAEFPCCKYSHHVLFQATNSSTTSSQNVWMCTLNLASECKPASTNHKRNVLMSYFWVVPGLTVPGETPNTCLSVDACRLTIPVEHLVVPQLPATASSLSSPVADASSRGSLPSSSQGNPVLFSRHVSIENHIWKGLSQGKSSTAVYSLNLKQCEIDSFCILCKLRMPLVLNPQYLISPPSALQLLF